MDEPVKILEEGTVVQASKNCLTVEVEGVEVHVAPRVEHSVCECCGAHSTLTVSYNRREEHRLEEHGEVDPLDLE